jgi:hypothetical protein
MQERLDHDPEIMRVRRQTVEHPYGTLKLWMGSNHFLTRTLNRVSTEMSLHVLACNLKRVMGIKPLIQAIQAQKPVFTAQNRCTQHLADIFMAARMPVDTAADYSDRNFLVFTQSGPQTDLWVALSPGISPVADSYRLSTRVQGQ